MLWQSLDQISHVAEDSLINRDRFGFAKLFETDSDDAEIVLTSPRDEMAPVRLIVVSNGLPGSVFTAFTKIFRPSSVRLTTASR
jgi:hypothetical protein